MERQPNQITTLSDLQKEFENMEMVSLVNNSLLDESVRDDDQAEINDDQIQYTQPKRELKMEIKGGMPATNRTQVSITSKTSTSTAGLAKQAYKKAGSITCAKPLQDVWVFGQYLLDANSGQIQSIAATLIQIGCTICNGFGHSRANCLTYKKIKSLSSAGTMFRKAISRGLDVVYKIVEKDGYVKGWSLGDAILQCVATWVKVQKGTAEEKENFSLLMYSLYQEIEFMKKLDCIYCGGYGHIHEDYVDAKDPDKEGVIKKRHKFKREMQYCVTKLEVEAGMRGFQAARTEYLRVLAEFHKTQRIDKISIDKVQLVDLDDAVGYFQRTVPAISNEQQVKAQQKTTQEIQQEFKSQFKSFVDGSDQIIATLDANLKSISVKSGSTVTQNTGQSNSSGNQPQVPGTNSSGSRSQVPKLVPGTNSQGSTDPVEEEDKVNVVSLQRAINKQPKDIETFVTKLPEINFKRYDGGAIDFTNLQPIDWKNFPIISKKNYANKPATQRVSIVKFLYVLSKGTFTGFEFPLDGKTANFGQGIRGVKNFITFILNQDFDACVRAAIFKAEIDFFKYTQWAKECTAYKSAEQLTATDVVQFADISQGAKVAPTSSCGLQYAPQILAGMK